MMSNNLEIMKEILKPIFLFTLILFLFHNCGTQAGKIYSCEYEMDDIPFDSLLVEFLQETDYIIHCSPRKPCKYVGNKHTTYSISVPLKQEEIDTFRLKFSVSGLIEPKHTFFAVLTGAKNGEVMEQTGTMTNKERRAVIDIFNSYLVYPFSEFLHRKNIDIEILNCEKHYYFFE